MFVDGTELSNNSIFLVLSLDFVYHEPVYVYIYTVYIYVCVYYCYDFCSSSVNEMTGPYHLMVEMIRG